MTLTTTQASALVELGRRGNLFPSARSFGATGRREFSSRTLQALVDAGIAAWTPNGNIVSVSETPPVVSLRTNYMDVALDNLAGTIETAKAKLSGVDFDTLVGTGFSGAVVVPALALAMGKYFVLVRKPKDGSHHNGPAIGHLGKRWVFVDDLVASGATRDRVKVAIGKCGQRTELVAEYHYARADYNDNGSMGILVGVAR